MVFASLFPRSFAQNVLSVRLEVPRSTVRVPTRASGKCTEHSVGRARLQHNLMARVRPRYPYEVEQSWSSFVPRIVLQYTVPVLVVLYRTETHSWCSVRSSRDAMRSRIPVLIKQDNPSTHTSFSYVSRPSIFTQFAANTNWVGGRVKSGVSR